MTRTALIAGCMVALIACGRNSAASKAADAQAAASAEGAKRIHTMEDSLFAKPAFDRKGATSLVDVYLAYAKTYPLDSLAPEFIFRAAGVKRTLGEPQAGIELYDRVILNYPSWRRLPDAYYLKAFTIDNDLHQKGEAKTAYQEVIGRFPDHRDAKDAQQMINNLNYTDQELIDRFEKMNADSANKEPSAGK